MIHSKFPLEDFYRARQYEYSIARTTTTMRVEKAEALDAYQISEQHWMHT
jgi:hypothetical protein